jgi:hypothetical protein
MPMTELNQDDTIVQDAAGDAAYQGESPQAMIAQAAFADTLPDDLRGNDAFKDMADASALARAYLDAKSRIPELPAGVEDYVFEFPEGLPVDTNEVDGFKSFALSQGITPAQARELVQFELTRQSRMALALGDSIAQHEQALRDEWRGDFDRNLELAKRVVNRFASSPEEAEAFHRWQDATGFGSNSALLKLLANVGRRMGEDALVPDQAPMAPNEPRRSPGGEPILHFPSMD